MAAGLAAVGSLSGCGSIVISSDPGPTTTDVPGPSVTVGLLVPLTGRDAALGQALKNGAELALTQYDADNPQVSVRFAIRDTGSMAARARAEARELVRDGVVAVLGPATDAEAAAVDPVLEAARIPQITVSATADALADAGDPYFHRVAASDSQAGTDVAQFVESQGATSAVVVNGGPDNDGDNTLAAALTQALSSAAVVQPAPPDFPSSSVTAADAAGTIESETPLPGAVVFVGAATKAGQLVEALRLSGYSGTIVLAGPAGDPGARATQAWVEDGTGAQAYLACACDDPGSALNQAVTFVNAYTAAYGGPPPEWSAQAFDAADVALRALASLESPSAGSVGPRPPISAQAVETALGTLSFAGVSGSISFDPATGNLTSPAVWISQAKDSAVTQQPHPSLAPSSGGASG